MTTFLHRTPADARRLPWRNGRGVTEELAIGPAGSTFEADDWAWRVSRATVVEDGPFSTFAGVDRVLVLTDGAGLLLRHGTGAQALRLPVLVAHAFPGDVATTATLVAGPVRDLNVMTRRGRCDAAVEVVRLDAGPARRTLPAGDVVVHVVAGEVCVRGDGHDGLPAALAAGDTLVATGIATPARVAIDGAPGAVVVVAAVRPAERRARGA